MIERGRKMKVIIAENYEDGARKAADIIEKIVRDNPECTLGLATGSSPVGMYKELARRCKEEALDFSRVHSVNLDEYVGLPKLLHSHKTVQIENPCKVKLIADKARFS